VVGVVVVVVVVAGIVVGNGVVVVVVDVVGLVDVVDDDGVEVERTGEFDVVAETTTIHVHPHHPEVMSLNR